MSAKFRTISLARLFNAPPRLSPRASRKHRGWSPSIKDVAARLPAGARSFWGIPFRLRPADTSRPGMIVLARSVQDVEVPLQGEATHVCVLHFCNVTEDEGQQTAGGEVVAQYTVRYGDGAEHRTPIRRRFEIHSPVVAWGMQAFASVPIMMPTAPPDDPTKIGWGWLQTGVTYSDGSVGWVYAIENPRPDAPLSALVLRGTTDDPVAVLGVTLYNGPGHPLRHVPRKVYRLILPPSARAKEGEVTATLDMGVVTRLYAAPAAVDRAWLDAEDRGLGQTPPLGTPSREFLMEATGAEGATLTVAVRGKRRHELPFGEAFACGHAESADGKARIEIVNPRTTWAHVTVVDESTGKPTPTRVHFRGPRGDYIAPYGHHGVVNDKWFEDYGGDLQLGGQSFAYVPGRFQIELPVGEAYVELSKGFEYEPVRRRLEIKAGQRELKLGIRRRHDLRRDGWVTADTHVHFISPQTAALEGKAEGLNLINLLASQWGRLFTNVADITGEASGCSDEETVVWVGTENRNHLLGHISMLGTRGDPCFPMCAGGPGEAYLGDPDVITLTEWARMCREREGVVIRPHFPGPVCEEPVYITLGELDAAELRYFGADPAAGPLEGFHFREWYRYLNCGYRVAVAGGTDKMSAGMPVGGVRTYAKLGPDEEFTFASWARAVRAGRTVTTSGPLLDMMVDGRPIGSEICLPPGGGTLEVEARASCVWPIHALEIVLNGKVVADSRSAKGAKSLSLKRRVRVGESSWIAARCGSRLMVNHCWPIRLGAHTSPVYVVCGGERMFSPTDAAYMLTLIDGGMTYLDTLSVRYSDERHAQMKAIYAEAKRELEGRMG
jgi:hypothetical protein